MKKKLLSILAAVLMAIAMMPMAAGTAYATTTYMEFGDALDYSFSSETLHEVYEGVTVELDLEKLAEMNDDLMFAYLADNIVEVCANTYIDGHTGMPVTLTPNGEGLYQWTVPKATGSSENIAYFWVEVKGGNTFTSRSYDIKKLEADGNAGSRTISLGDGSSNVTVTLDKRVPVADGRELTERGAVRGTLEAAGEAGNIAPVEFTESEADYSLANIDFDQDGNYDMEIEWTESDDTCYLRRLPNCSIQGDYHIDLSEGSKIKLNIINFAFYENLTFSFSGKSIEKASVKLKKTSFTYDGTEKKPKATVKLKKKTLKAGVDYTLDYMDNIDAGEAKAIVKGTGNYAGTVTKTFKIKKAANPLKIEGMTSYVPISELREADQTQDVTDVINFIKDGEGDMSYTKVSGNSAIMINSVTGQVTVQQGLDVGTYKVKVKVKASGDKNYKPSSTKTVTFKIKVNDDEIGS